MRGRSGQINDTSHPKPAPTPINPAVCAAVRMSPAKLNPAPTIGTASISRSDPSLTRIDAAAAATHRAKIPTTASHHDCDKAGSDHEPEPDADADDQADDPAASGPRHAHRRRRQDADRGCAEALRWVLRRDQHGWDRAQRAEQCQRPSPGDCLRVRRRSDHPLRTCVGRAVFSTARAYGNGKACPDAAGASIRSRAPVRRAASAPASAARASRVHRHRRRRGPA